MSFPPSFGRTIHIIREGKYAFKRTYSMPWNT
ncbi:hypothetical protein SALBM311S_01513 [Streptomyces alboniger]